MSPISYSEAADLGDRFGRVAAIVVLAYGQVLLLKILLVAVLLSLAAANKLRHVPKLKQGDPAAANQLGTSLSVEWNVVLGILVVTAVLTTNLTPPV